MPPDQPGTHYDWEVIARNVRGARKHQGLSQSELARRAGVDLASVYRVEKGEAVRTGTLRKVSQGLNIIFEDLLIDRFVTQEEDAVPVHRASEARWYSAYDRRQRPPTDKDDLNQTEEERRRLGRLGLVPWFICPPLIIPPKGPGIVLLEIYDTLGPQLNAEFYEDGALYILKGAASVTVGEKRVLLGEGDWVAFKTGELKGVQVSPPHEVAVAMWIGATRPKRR